MNSGGVAELLDRARDLRLPPYDDRLQTDRAQQLDVVAERLLDAGFAMALPPNLITQRVPRTRDVAQRLDDQLLELGL
jgi:hypothetical protein